MTRLESAPLTAAVHWWKGKRPCSFSFAEHLENPTVNTCTDREKALAKAVARYLLEQHTLSEKDGGAA